MKPGAPAAFSQSRDAPAVKRGLWEGFTRFLGRREVLPILLLLPVLIFFIVWNLIRRYGCWAWVSIVSP